MNSDIDLGLVPEDPTKVTGPEIGTLCLVVSPYSWLSNRVARVTARSYVWSPETVRPDGYRGHRRYDWSVIEYGKGKTLVVDDADLQPLSPGMVAEVRSWGW